ncbi:MAG: thymidine phosphorylase, partial [Tissierellia bacterium]|nr:thymidine phosphorylase [Tissierellia bacterium]
EPIDLTAGIYLPHKIGSFVEKGELLAKLFTSRSGVFEEAEKRLLASLEFSATKPQDHKLVRALVYEEDGQSKVQMWN